MNDKPTKPKMIAIQDTDCNVAYPLKETDEYMTYLETELAELKEKIVEYLGQLVEMSVYGSIAKSDFKECNETYWSELIEKMEKELHSDEK